MAESPASMFKSSKAHLAEVDESYFAHLKAAFGISGRLMAASAACAVHAVIPGLCTHTASNLMSEIRFSIARRRANSAVNPLSSIGLHFSVQPEVSEVE
jgi:hypothetical protein